MNNNIFLSDNLYPGVGDIYSKFFSDRIIMVTSTIDANVANLIKSQLLFLNDESSTEPIKMYIDSPGGMVYTSLGILDIMDYIEAPIETINIGEAASMAAVILSNGTVGMRKSLPRSRTMLHQPLGGTYGQVTDIEIASKEALALKKILTDTISINSGQSFDKVSSDMERDFWMDAKSCKKYGIIDEIIKTK